MIPSNALLEVNLKNLVSNYKYLSFLNKNHITGATIKANAYGLGDKKIINILYNNGCRYFFVATLEEAIKLRKSFKYGYLYVLNGIKKTDFLKIRNLLSGTFFGYSDFTILSSTTVNFFFRSFWYRFDDFL